jgi:hypothetical protein
LQILTSDYLAPDVCCPAGAAFSRRSPGKSGVLVLYERQLRSRRIVATPGALERSGETPITFLQRHIAGDWGILDEDDRAENDLSVREGFRLLSSYELSDGTKIWIITEADRSSTPTLPSEY